MGYSANRQNHSLSADDQILPALLLHEVLEASDIGMFVLDADRKIVAWNHWLEVVSGVSFAAAAGKKMDRLFPELAGSRLQAVVKTALEQGMPGVLSQKFHPHILPLYKTPDDRAADIRISQMIKVKPLILDSRFCLVQVFDVTSAVSRDQMLREQTIQHRERELRARAMLSSIADAVIATDKAGRVEFINLVAEGMIGYSGDLVQGKPLDEVFRVYEECEGSGSVDPQQVYLPLQKLITTSSKGLMLKHRDGLCFPIEKSLANVRDERGEMQGMVIVFRDVSRSRKLAAQLSWQASHDALTGLYNRVAFDSQLGRLLEQASHEQTEHSLLYLDLDRFKVVNDTCGHIAGDELLRQITAVIKQSIRSNDILARLGGDEFGILLESCPIDAAEKIANQVRLSIQDFRFAWGDKHFNVGVSIGLVGIDHESEGVEQILSLADTACYAAKDAGRNQVHVYRPDESLAAQRHGEVRWVTKIRSALEEDRFVLYVQPIRPTDVKADGEEHLEVLIRMLDESGGLVMPGAFIPAAERYDLMPAIDRWVVRRITALIDLHRETFFTRKTRFFINLSGSSLNGDETLDCILEQLGRLNLDQSMLCFEVTETAAIANLSSAEHFIRTLQNYGCEFALDDFGSGLSSFSYLKHLPVDYLKIDGVFVKDMADDPIDYSMVEAINNIGHIMGLRTIAEFVENDRILEKLQAIGVDYAQGYGIRRPFPLDELLREKGERQKAKGGRATG